MAAASRREQLVVEGRHQAADTRGERQLAWAVLETAFNDLTAEGANQISNKARMEARLFCTSLDGEWAHSRRKWCDLAELDESSFVRAARRVVDESPTVVLPDPPAKPRQEGSGKYTHTGEGNNMAKMTVGGIRDMRVMLAAGVGLRTCAKRWHLTKSTVEKIRDRKTWAHVQ